MEGALVSVVIVSFNTCDKTRRCLSCIESHHEVIVVDNASDDGSVEMVRSEFPHVRLIANDTNVGFGVANNQGARLSDRPLILYLNSDAYASPEAIDQLAHAFNHPRIVAAGGKLLNPDGSVQESVASRLTLAEVFLEQTLLEPLFRRVGIGYWRSKWLLRRDPGREVYIVDQVMGACLMVRRGLAEFDERFFLYCEDTELCRRLSKEGAIAWVPRAEFTHELGSSSSEHRWKAVARYNRGKELYFRIHHGRIAAMMCWFMNRDGAGLRLIGWLLISIVRPSRWSQVRLFWKVMTAPIAGPDGPKR